MWYYEEAGQTIGPVTEQALRAAIAAGRVGPATLVWRDGMGGWLAAAQTELASAFGNPAGGDAPWQTPGQFAPQGGNPGLNPGYAPEGGPTPNFGAPNFGAPGYGAAPRFAGFWIRLGAYLIDVMLVEIAAYLLQMLVGEGMFQAVLMADRSMDLSSVNVIGTGAQLALMLAYFTIPVAGPWQATPGKRLLGLRVIRADGQRVGVGTAIGRYFGYFLSSIIFCAGFLMIAFTDQKKGLHDMIVGTRVIHGRT